MIDFNVIRWYKSLAEQEHNAWYNFGEIWPIISPNNQILPFQIIINYSAITSISPIKLHSISENKDIVTDVTPVKVAVENEVYDIVMVHSGINSLSQSIPVGKYYMTFTVDGVEYFSNIFYAVDNIEDYVKIEYWNDIDLQFKDGRISYANDFKYNMYVHSTIGKPGYSFEEESTKRGGYTFIEYQTSTKIYKFVFLATESICDSLRIVKLSDYINIYTKNNNYKLISFSYNTEWQDQGNLASVEVEFEIDLVIQKLSSFNRSQYENFYNALLADFDDPLMLDSSTVALYSNNLNTNNGKLIRQLSSINKLDNPYYFVVDDGGEEAKKVTVETVTNFLKGYFHPKEGTKDLDFKAKNQTVYENQIVYGNSTVSGTTTTLNLIVQRLATIYDLDVAHVATLFNTVIKNQLSSEKFISGFTGEGMKLWQAINGDWNLEIDNLTARKAFYVFELILQKIRSVNGALAITQGNGTIKSVSETTGSPAYYVCEIDGDMTFEVGDFVRCQVFSTSRLKYYWVKVYQVTGNSIYLLKSDFSTDIPEAGDEIVQIGNDTNPNRQSVLYLSASEDGKPRFSVLDGVNSPSFVGKTKAVLGYIGDIVDSNFPAEHQPSGYGLYCQNAFLSGIFVLSNGKSIEDEIGNINTQIIAIPGLISSSVTEEVSKIEIGGRNLVLKSDQIFTARISSKMYDMSKTWLSLKGKTVAISFDYSYTNATTDSSNHILWFEQALDTDTGTSYALSQGISLPITSAPISGSGRYTGTALVPSNIVNTSTTKVATLIIKMIGGSGTITNFKIEEGNKATDWSPAPEDAKNYTDDAINNIQIGGRNLLPNSKDVSDTPTSFAVGYLAAYRNLTRTLNAGETVIFSYSGVTSNSIVGFALYSLNSSIDVFPANTPVTLTKSYTYFRVRVSSSAAFAADYMKLEAGTKATDWSPAPEDVQAELDSKVAVTVYESGITQLQSSINSKVSQTDFNALGNRVSSVETEVIQTPNKITQAIKETSIGGDNLLPNLQQRWARGRFNSSTGAIEVPSGTGWSYMRINIYCAEFFPVNGGETLVFSAPTDHSYTCFPAQYDASKTFIPVAPELYYMRNYYDENQPDNLKFLTLKPQTRYVRWQIQCSYGSETGDFYPSWFETNHAQVEIGTKPSAYKTPFTDVTYTGIDIQQGKIFLTSDKVEISGSLIVKGIQNGGINVGGNCIITSTGLITAKGATIEGKITATSGSIGGVSISNSRIGIDSSSSTAVGSFLAAGYLGVRSKANYFRVDANDAELQCTINKQSDTTPCIDIKNTSTSGGSEAATAIRAFGKNELYGGTQIITANATLIDDAAPKIEVTRTDLKVTLRYNNTGTYVTGYLRITSSPATGGAATVQFVRD